jgi:hypothetical protein
MVPAEEQLDPIFVGGTQRSGTSITGQLIGRHPLYARIREVQFHANEGGLEELLTGRTSLRAFLERLRSTWWRRPLRHGTQQERGLFTIVEDDAFHAAVERFEASFAEDRVAAGRRLVKDLIDPAAAQQKRGAWVETTPNTAQAAPTLVQMFPQARFIHMARDGRDVACSLARLGWGPEDPVEGIDFWAERLRRAEAGIQQVPEGQALVLQLEDLVHRDREGSLEQILEFTMAGPAAVRRMREFFDRRMSAEAGHVQRWKEELDGGQQAALNERYRQALEELHAEGVRSAPPLEVAQD